MKTKATEKFPEIEWETTTELLDKDIDERMEVYLVQGWDNAGNLYQGSAYYFCDELDEIKDIEITANYGKLPLAYENGLR